MKRLFISLIFIMLSTAAFSQLRVVPGSFKLIPDDLRGQIEMKEDDNGYKCSVLKIKTINISEEERVKFRFSADAQTQIVEYQFQTGEIWVWLTADASMIRFKHPDLSTLRFDFPYSIEPKRTYEITIENVKNEPGKPAVIYTNTLTINAMPSEAKIYINDEFIANGTMSNTFGVGSVIPWRIECDMYHASKGEIEITKGEPVVLTESLKPAFGYISVSSKPESGADVYIDGEIIGKTPITSGRLASGEHKVKIVKDLYKDVEKTYTVTDGNTITADLTMPANFAEVTISTDDESDIYIDNELKGKGRWKGRLKEGTHLAEARKVSHETATKTLNIITGKNESFTIENPKPIYGVLDIKTNPEGVTVIIDGQNRGITPKVLDEVLIGSRSLKLEKNGCAVIIKEITIEKNKTLSISEKLFTGKDIAINSEPNGANVYIDGNNVGITPIYINMAFGKHIVKVSKDGNDKNDTINVSDNENSSYDFDLRKNGVGSLYVFSDGSKGIVFYLGSDGHGLVVSLDQIDKKWDNGKDWRVCQNIEHIPNERNYKMRLKVGLGGKYTSYIINQLGRGQAPAAEWCRSKGDEWYLPSAGELWQLLCVANGKKGNLGAISKALENNGGAGLSGYYWSSSECSNYDAWTLDGGGYTTNLTKSYYTNVRAVRAF